VEQTPGAGGPFTLGTDSRIVVSDAELAALGGTVAGQLRPATGYALPVVTGAARPGDVALVKAPVAELPADNDVAAAEGYKLAVSSAGALLTAPTDHGLFNAFQSLRQLLPAAVYAETARLVAWTVAPTTVVDYPRYGYRGLQIDPARNFIQVDEVKAIIDEVAAVKTNVLHMRLSDTQAWRFEVKAPADAPDKYRNLERYATGQMYTNSSNRGCEGVGCITGFYTQDDFKEIVAYANAQYVEILPELEGPGHATGAVVALNRTMACTGSGMSNFCAVPGNAATEAALQFWRDAIGQLAAISTGPAIHIGGDYVTGVTLTDYRYWIAQMEQIVNENGKTAVSYNPGLDGYQNPDSVNQYYSDYSPPAWGQQAAPGWFDHGRPTIVMPDNNTYLAHPYSGTPASGTNAMEAMKVWNWDPEWFVERYRDYNVSQVAWGGPRPEDIVGVEASVAGENMRGRLPNEYMIFPRFAGIAEKAWSPRALTQDHGAYQARLKAQGARWSYQGVNFGTIPETEWGAEASGAVVDFGPDLRVEGAELAALAAPGVDYTAVTATVDWGDGSPVSAAAVSGTDYLPASRAGRSLITATADHAYAAPGALGGTVTFAWDGQSVTVPFGTERGFDVAVTLLPRCVVGQVYLYGSVKNNDEVPLDVTITTAYGSKTVANVTPGRSGSGTFAVKAASVGDGSGSVAVTPSQGAPSERLEVPASYAGVGCG
jgi:hexosaminidase